MCSSKRRLDRSRVDMSPWHVEHHQLPTVAAPAEDDQQMPTGKRHPTRTPQALAGPRSRCPENELGIRLQGHEHVEERQPTIGAAIDVATHKTILMALPNRTANVAADAILHNPVHREVPLLFHTDAAAEMMGRVMTELWRMCGTHATTTLAHHATGNALQVCERVWRLINVALRCLTNDQYKDWHRYLSAIEAAWNSAVRSTLGMSPFQASTVLPVRTPVLLNGNHTSQERTSNGYIRVTFAPQDKQRRSENWRPRSFTKVASRTGRPHEEREGQVENQLRPGWPRQKSSCHLQLRKRGGLGERRSTAYGSEDRLADRMPVSHNTNPGDALIETQVR